MKIEEIVKSLRACSGMNCANCPAGLEPPLTGPTCYERLSPEAADALENLLDRCARYAEEIAVLQERHRWIPVTERQPAGDDQVLIVASGKPRENIELVNAAELASFCSDGWCLENWPDWTGAIVTHWMPLPEAPEV